MRFSLMLLLLLFTAGLDAQTIVNVNVTDATTGVVLKGVVVSVTPRGGKVMRAATDSSGVATFTNLTAGSHSVSAQAVGYETATVQVDVEAGFLTDVNLSLRPAPIGLKPVEATAKAEAPRVPDLMVNGFYERMKFNNGIFIDQAEIEKRGQRLISDLIRSKPGVNLRPDSTGEILLWFRGNEGAGFTQALRLCGPTIFVDGLVVHQSDGQTASPIDQFIKTIDLAGIEIYRRPSQIPVQYGGATSACGVVLLWSRVRS